MVGEKTMIKTEIKIYYVFIMENREVKKFLGIMFECCNVYGRIYKNKEGTYYEGRCPRCMRLIKIRVGEGGVNQRFFKAY
jgi:hypothetical protein